jgi:hypothetical protein
MNARLTAAQAALRASDITRLAGLTSALSEAVSDSYVGLDCRTASDIHAHLMDPQAQREADLLAFGDDDITDPAYKDWCTPAKLKHEFGTPFLGVKYLQEIRDSESDDAIEKAIHSAIYLTEKQEQNRHDRIMVDVPKDGHRKGGTHGLPPEKRRKRSGKIVNESLTCKALVQIPGEEDVHEADRLDRAEAEAFYHSISAKLARQNDYILSIYNGKYRNILELFLQGKTHSEIVTITGKSERRIRQVINGDVQKGRKAKPGLRQFCLEIQAKGVPVSFQSTPPVLVEQPVPVVVQQVHTLKKSLQSQAPVAQLAWDFDAMGVAA